MKKLLAGLFVFGAITMATQAHALTLSDALSQIQNLKNEIILLRASLKGSAFDPTKSSIEIYPPYEMTKTSVIAGIKVNSVGTAETGSLLKLYYGTTPHPTTTSVTVNLSPAIASIYQYKLTSLDCDTKYYYYGSIGSSYSPDGTFTTAHCDSWVNTGVPVISYPAAASVTSSGVTFVGSITSSISPVTDWGVCYKKSGQSYGCLPGSGSINGSFGLPVYGLTPSTVYYYYIYANNSASRVTSSEGTFTTTAVETAPVENNTPSYSSSIPKVAIHTAPPGLTSTTAAVGGVITSYGSTSGISERGACYGLTSTPTNCVPAYLVQGPNDMFATKFAGLTPDTTYYYRIYVKYASGTVYSTNGTFKTLAGSAGLTPVNGEWSSWTNSGSCVGGYQTQVHSCTNPAPSNGGLACLGLTTQQVSCSAGLPNLVAGKVENLLSSYPVSTVAVPSIVAFTSTITNSGTSATTGTLYHHFELAMGLNGSGSINSFPISSTSLASNGGNTKVNYSTNLTTAGNYSARFCADQASSSNKTGYITESNENDNCGNWTNFVVSDNSNLTPSITVLSPNGNEVYTAGQQITVKWKTENFPSSYYISIEMMDDISKIDYKDNGRSLRTLNDGEALFTIPVDDWDGTKLIGGKRYKIGMWSGMNEGYPNLSADWSDNLFTINPLTVTCPANVASVTCPPYQTEAVKDANGCIVKFQCTSESNLKNATVTGQNDASTVSTTPINRTLRWGMRGDDVKRLQEFLGIYADGIFGRGTMLAVKAWQAKNGLRADGIFGYNSRIKSGLSNIN